MEEHEIINEALERAQKAHDADQENREKALEDLRFINGEEQWDSTLKAQRQGRPCLVINLLPERLDTLLGDQRQNKPRIEVLPVDDHADPETAVVIEGVIRNIENQSMADIAYSTGFEAAAECGYGCLCRITTEYISETTFEQEIRIQPMAEQFSVLWDPAAKEYSRNDGEYMFIIEEKVSREEFKRRWPDKTPMSFEAAKDSEAVQAWVDEDYVRVAEYFRKEYERKTIYELPDGTVTDREPEEEEYLRKRTVDIPRIKWRRIDASQVLEGPQEWPSRYWPVIPIWGKQIHMPEQTTYRGMVRHAKDPQRMYNYWASVATETVAQTSKAPYLLTPKMVEGHESMWRRANKENLAYLLFNPDPQTGNMHPRRETPPTIPTGAVEERQNAGEDVKRTTGVHDPMVGAQGNEVSGVAIRLRQQTGGVGNLPFIDNLSRSIRQAGVVILDLIPKIYDTPRVLRILGREGEASLVQVNEPVKDKKTGVEKLFDLTVGKYDVVIAVGPSYITQRMEAADSMMNFVRQVPDAAVFIADLIAKYQDWPGAEEIAERLRRIVPPEALEEEEGQGGVGVQPPPDPMMELDVQIKAKKLEQEQAQLEGILLENRKKELEIAQEEAALATGAMEE